MKTIKCLPKYRFSQEAKEGVIGNPGIQRVPKTPVAKLVGPGEGQDIKVARINSTETEEAQRGPRGLKPLTPS